MKYLFFLLLMSHLAIGLEVDEKLTIRLLKISETRKTVLINRGTEDGLVEGDHAKFIVTAGIVARAMCVKVSPSRSVWSVYRLVNSDFMVMDSVMSLKITPPVKMTKDESQSLLREDSTPPMTDVDPTNLGIPLAEGALDNEGGAPVGTESAADLNALTQEEETISHKVLEVVGMINISGLTSTTQSDSGSFDFSHAFSSHHLGLGLEYYAQKERLWYSAFSLSGGFNLLRLSSQSYNGAGVSNNMNEIYGAVSWHPTKRPGTPLTFIPYLQLAYGVGQISSTYSNGSELNGAEKELSASGPTQSLSLGFGYKFYTTKGYSVRLLADIYSRSERYSQDDDGRQFNRYVQGPRLILGLGYRF